MRLVPERNHQDSNDPNIIEVDSILMRDYFAAQAVHCFQLDDASINVIIKGAGTPMHEVVAKFCYDFADAMMKERSR